MQEEDVFGYHLVVNCAACDKKKISSEENIKAFTKMLIEKIDMVAFGDPLVIHFASHNPAAGGYTLLQLIETSNISAHFVDASGDAYIDVFSCKIFDKEVALKVIDDFFSPTKIVSDFFVRSCKNFKQK